MNNKPILTLRSPLNNAEPKPSLNTPDVMSQLITKTKSVDPKTNTSNNKQAVKPKLSEKEKLRLKKERRLEKYKAQFLTFNSMYPKCFLSPPKPLTFGIDEILIKEQQKKPEEERLSKTMIKKFLFGYTASAEYKAALKVDAPRIDLQGNEVSKVSLVHSKDAMSNLSKQKDQIEK